MPGKPAHTKGCIVMIEGGDRSGKVTAQWLERGYARKASSHQGMHSDDRRGGQIREGHSTVVRKGVGQESQLTPRDA